MVITKFTEHSERTVAIVYAAIHMKSINAVTKMHIHQYQVIVHQMGKYIVINKFVYDNNDGLKQI